MSLDSLACGHDNVKQSKIVALTVSLGRKNFLFFGSDHGGERGALLYSLIGTCKLNDVDPESYLRHVLGVIALAEQQHGADADMGVVAGTLEFRNGFRVIAAVEELSLIHI